MDDVDLFGHNDVVFDSEGEGNDFEAALHGLNEALDTVGNRGNEQRQTDGLGGAHTAQNGLAYPLEEPHFDGGTPGILSIADRAKTRTRGMKQTQPAASSSSSFSPRTWRARKAPGPVVEVIELTSDEDDFVPSKPKKAKSTTKAKDKCLPPPEVPESRLKTPSKPRPRPRPRNKGNLPPSLPALPDSTLPHPTSPSRFSETFPYPPSELPPSDPPTSTPHIFEHPPIAVLGGSEPPTSSFSSLYSPVKQKESKERTSLPDSVTGGILDDSLDDSVFFDRPPPTFFAGSSPPPPISVLRAAQPTPHEIEPEVVPATATFKAGPKKQAKPRKSRKKVANEEQGDDGPPSTKARSKRKPKSKVEVVMPPPERLREHPIPQGDDATFPAIGVESAAFVQKAIGDRRDSISSLSPVPDSEDEPELVSSGKKRKALETDETQGSPKKKVKGKGKEPTRPAKSKGKARQVIVSDDEDAEDDELNLRSASRPVEETFGSKHNTPKSKRIAKKSRKDAKTPELEAPNFDSPEEEASAKENFEPPVVPKSPPHSSKAPQAPPSRSSISSGYTIAPKTKSTPMSELIKRANSLPGSPFPASPSPAIKRPPSYGLAYSPYLKSSKSMLSRIAPLHMNRKTPPPPLPPPPPRKKTKKELEREEKWEEELVDSVGGIEAWACMTDAERSDLRKAKRAMEMGDYD